MSGFTMKRFATLLAVLAMACGGGDDDRSSARRGGDDTAGGENRPAEDGGRCDTSGEGREISEYDTNGDEHPDVRKVFITIGEGRLARLVLVCREADLNGDGVKDVIRFYNDEGRPLREESDRDFNGQVDAVTLFERGRIVRQELDENGDGRIDAKIFYDNGRPQRAERDLAGRSTATQWHPDRWEYYEEGRLTRMGTDLDGDGGVDRWDRDAAEHRRRLEEMRAEEEAAEREAAQAEAAAGADA